MVFVCFGVREAKNKFGAGPTWLSARNKW